ncbi:sigma-70 family RNA polymerase sigma factor [Marinicella sp. S1101]|uniref:sigma-70 family RNA polymerase sigma factor n=1 Tax=Marinicella marina TaxID=2996016 RepID=UPI00226090E9|nr:sigma-70 family RNA polymerase sigma factor [Marinicella marina]MCX7555080.1 sigma-70 family RNA polymerase sigma factor [Marinicella marina]MDJ1141388.1 sigma-70 family RNA polymerase sigma factor [Marinicella marina]
MNSDLGNEKEGLDEVIYLQLKQLARKLIAKERTDHTLSATDLVHEAFAKLLPSHLSFNDQKHYYYTFARQMRRVLLNHATHKNTKKNNADVMVWTESLGVSQQLVVEFDVFNQALEYLEKLETRSAQAIELVYFTELTQAQAAACLSISLATLERDLKFGRVVIHKYLENAGRLD